MPKLDIYNYTVTTCFLVLINVVSELISSLVLIIFLPKHFHLKKIDFKPNLIYIKDILNISLPTTSTRIIGTIGYFLEPIIITKVLTYKGLSNVFIMKEYGIYNAYTIATLCIPSFFINAISLALLPELTKCIGTNTFKKRCKESFKYTLILGIFFTSIIFIFRDNILITLYKTNLGSSYIKILSPFSRFET